MSRTSTRKPRSTDTTDDTTAPVADDITTAPVTDDAPEHVADTDDDTSTDDTTAPEHTSTDDDTDDAPEQSPGDAFAAAYVQAIGARDLTTGAVPAADLDAMTGAFRKLRGNERVTLPAQYAADWTAVAAADLTDQANVSVILAVQSIGAAIAAAASSKAPARVAPKVDPVDVAVGRLVALDIAKALVVGALDDEQKAQVDEQVGAILRGEREHVADWKVSFGRNRGTTTTRAPREPGAERRDLRAEVLAQVTSADAPMSYGAIAKALDASAGAVQNALGKLADEGKVHAAERTASGAVKLAAAV